jgi:hypothetical protein
MGWFDYHFWEFTIGKQGYGLPMDDDWEPSLASRRARCACVTCSGRDTIIDYIYGWEHRLTAIRMPSIKF